MKKIISVVGARPNFMKIAPLYKILKDGPVQHLICHTGQHYDEKMSKVFFDDLELPHPDFYLGVGGGTITEQTAHVMLAFDKIVQKEKPDLIVVVGDVTSTIACSMVAVRHLVRVAHIEAGLRSFDRTMPEEINRELTDTISDLLFVTEMSGKKNLIKEGKKEESIYFVGNLMIDSVVHYMPKADRSTIVKDFDLKPGAYTLVTLHRPRNVDAVDELEKIIALLNELSNKTKIIFPIHPRTQKNIVAHGLRNLLSERIIITDPIGYIDFLALMKNASLIITDSGGIQEETTYLGIQCITARDNTERPVTVEIGTNQLAGTDWNNVGKCAVEVLEGKVKNGTIPELWDGNAASRIANILLQQ
ncbi:MAG: UDP-N-acetylglucosamine 2-epimerase (non-hydrolyzing) [Bacteroidota bacterium]